MKHWSKLAAMTGLAAITTMACAEPQFRDGKTWCGDPDAVQSVENPYVQLAERNVDRSLEQGKDIFWIAWGYAAPESRRKGDPALKEQVVATFDKAVAQMVAKKTGYWELLGALEAMRLLRRSADFPAGQVDKWLADLRVCVEANYDNNTKTAGWETRAPNTLHQSAAILQLASILYNEKRYAELAASLVKKTAPLINPDGAFPYLPNSGPSPLYFGFDATFLGRYYQLSRDPVARDLLLRMAAYGKDALPNGLLESASSPWWKYSFVKGGPLHGVEIVAGLSRDPTTRALAQYRLKEGQPYFYSYYPQFFWDDTIPLGKLGEDLCRFNTNFDGPQLRSGDWQVVMPAEGFADKFVGATLASGANLYKFDGELGGVSLAILSKGVTDPAARPGSAVTAAPDDLKAVSLVGEGWIASAVMFAPRPLYFGDPKPPGAAPWQVAQVWFADKDALGGWIQATPTSSTGVINGPIGILHMGLPATLDGRSVQSGAMAVKVYGNQVDRIVAEKDGKRLQVHLSETGERSYQKGEYWGFGASASAAPNEARTVEAMPGAVLQARIKRSGGGEVVLLLNTSSEPQPVELAPVSGSVWRAAQRDVKAAGPSPHRALPGQIAPGELIVVTP